MREYESRVEKTPALEQELTLLMRDYENMQSNYQRLLEKRLNARVAENLEKRQKGEQFRIIDPANFPEKPEKPNQVRIMLMGLAVGLALGFGGAFSLELLQPVFRRSEDVEGLLGLPILATIPLFESVLGKPYKFIPNVTFRPFSGRADRRLSAPEHEGDSNGMRELDIPQSENKQLRPALTDHQVIKSGMQLPPDVNLIYKWRPWSVVAEQFRVAATRLTLMQANRTSTIVIVTSSVKGEGKSCITVNLGYVLARDLGKSTLIVDCDLKCPVVHKYAGLKHDPGLRDILNGKEPVDNCIQSCGDVPLWAITAGSSAASTTELSKVHQLNKILSELRTRFDYILLDAPPILPLADMHVLAGMADVVAMVIRSGTTSQALVKKGLNTLRPTKETCIILNGLQAEMVPYYMQEGYDYFIQKKELPRV
jgi:polysaccharide biosynthesis transport protein